MSRTYREIPDSGLRDREERNCKYAYEEKKGRVHNTKTVRDKDNHGCTYSTPKWWRKVHQRRMRSNVNDQLNKFTNENWNNLDDIREPVLSQPKEYRPWYW